MVGAQVLWGATGPTGWLGGILEYEAGCETGTLEAGAPGEEADTLTYTGATGLEPYTDDVVKG